jgi:anaerobic ribonucleoside-triphosphate reductase activating protein
MDNFYIQKNFAGIMDNDIVDGIDGISVSFWTQGCPFHCPGCHNQETWDFKGGIELPNDYINIVIDKLKANGIKRNLSILGGEPLCPENILIVHNLCKAVKYELPDTKIMLWTGYTMEQLKKRIKQNPKHCLKTLLNNELDFIIDGPYKQELRDLRLKLRGSSNQNVWKRIKTKFLKRTIWKKLQEDNI